MPAKKKKKSPRAASGSESTILQIILPSSFFKTNNEFPRIIGQKMGNIDLAAPVWLIGYLELFIN